MTYEIVDAIREETMAVLRQHASPGDRVAHLDFPNHFNAGDSLIYAGEVEYLKQLDVHVDYVSDPFTHNNDLLEQRVGDGTLFLQGGGNFGDRWPMDQKFREAIVARFPRNKIVCLPQSIDYSDADAMHRTAALYAQHPDLTLMLREQRSYELALAHFPNNRVEYCPDMAFGAEIAHSAEGSAVDVVKLVRDDSESLGHASVNVDASSVQYDWGLHGRDLAISTVVTLPTRIAYNFPTANRLLYPALVRSYEQTAKLNLRVAQRILNLAPVVLTDRLHAAVLAAMMGKRVVAMDNANRKVSGIYDAYLHRFDNVQFAATPDAAADMVRQAVSDSRR
ncbi:polysaccharide pyruvyl transferase family protein [Rhodococcus fascians]|nr:polysaccharide pyruvyl transferase family protein [Rhodococcus fascians]MBY4136710.1 polysaccharide pyruvyl transferase family protein [Rhodococcus fascians]MBY4218712.1 polysaccharide pyruvyl transferase family protein [Rhodococcus fascians]MBY4221746.1 polysaccharide pyruvyl transferase family protein [Rhodococcus fascians]MBY4232253.1 polysaccharide pyruvyl transferase family protein [Rhodococcus fascians]